MAETLGTLCDKLTVIKLKQWHSEDPIKLASLAHQENEIKSEIDQFITNATTGKIPMEKLSFSANKIYKQDDNFTREITGSIAGVFYQLADINCKLWHEQEKVYDFEKVPIDKKNGVVKQLAILNLERNKCIEQIDLRLCELIEAQYRKG